MEEMINLKMNKSAYAYIHHLLDKNRSTISQLRIHEGFKTSLLEDADNIKNVLKKQRKKGLIMLSKIEAFLAGKKTYIVAIVTGLLATWQALGHPVPDFVYAILGALGLGSVRSAIGTTTPKA
jgi:hypothetical protein